jgi:phage terminase Nu1 subunit (DNA packaging protein)
MAPPKSPPLPSPIIAPAKAHRRGRRQRAQEKKEKPRIVGIKELAAILNLTPRRIQQLVEEGFPKKLRGKYDLLKCARWYIRYLRAVIEKKEVPMPDGAFAGERQEHVRLVRASADLREVELAREQSELLSVEDVEREMTNLIRTARAHVMAIAPRMAPELVGETSRVMIQAKLEKACKEALAQLARPVKDGDSPEPQKRGC